MRPAPLMRLLGPLFALSIVVTACGSDSPSTSSSAASSAGNSAASSSNLPPLKVGSIISQTGTFAAVGAGILRGVQQAEATWNSDASHRQIKVSSCDDQSTPEGGLACFNQLRDDSDVIVGPHLFPSYAAVKDIVSGDGPVLFTGVPFSAPAASSFIFQTQPNIDDIVDGQLAYAAKAGLKKVASITSNDQPGNLGKAAVARLASKHGVDIVSQESLDPTAQNLAPQASNVAAAQPDAVISWTIGAPLVNVLRALHDAGVTAPVLMGSGSMSAPILAQAADQTPPQLLFVASAAFEPAKISDATYRARVEDFNKSFVAQFQQVPDNNAYLAADAVFYAAQAGGSASSTADIKKSLESGTPVESLLWGPYKYTADDHVGTKSRDFSVLEWHLETKSWTIVD